ncbi:hypothetical protein I6F43_08005 [Pseudoalteromonas sp. NZS71_1]|uniref:hypothetical protein n=1 Tax=Pseudoalteromonas sp. NZS71_1 TaxID=2792072 RepID=UPI0018CF5B89|nr:hypothetical protein [Pseudoalteromonas sp. NZS71_1]MBH0034624.1 hypothetical protein [Pseudoalteromonas sp. NZS71_1]
MAASAGAWYRVGKVNVTNNNQSVVGVDTNWQNDVIAIAIGDVFTLDAKTWYEVTAVNSDTSITLDRGFEGSTGENETYAIVRNTSGTILTRIAGQVSVQFNQKQLFLDELRTWLNSDSETEELTDSHGLKQSLKTPSQMVRDHDNKLAELDAINPHPYAMRKVEFEALREINADKVAANGFVHFGKHWDNTVPNRSIGEGLYTHHTIPNTLLMGRGTTDSSFMGDSDTLNPVLSISGVLVNLTYLSENTAGGRNAIIFPPAESGLRTYDKSNGQSVTHSTSTIAFASESENNKVVTERVDMWGLEFFLREISSSDPFVYPGGLIQSKKYDCSGVTCEPDNIRPQSYFAWYEGHAASQGNGVNWNNATDQQKALICSDPKNNIYFDDATGKFYQWCVRGRSFAGAGNGTWENLDPQKAALSWTSSSSQNKRIAIQGTANSVTWTGSGESNHYYGSLAPNHDELGLFTSYGKGKAANAVAGEAYVLVCGTVSRLNKGAYHPSYNRFGTRGFLNESGRSAVSWAESDLRVYPTKKSDCFDYPTTVYPYTDGIVFSSSADSSAGSIDGGESTNKRQDGRYFDAIYASGDGGVIRDMRYMARGLERKDFDLADKKIKSDTFRGLEFLPYCGFEVNLSQVSTGSAAYIDQGSIHYVGYDGKAGVFNSAPAYGGGLSALNLILVRDSDGAIFKTTAWNNEYHSRLMQWDGTQYQECTGDASEYNTKYRGYLFDGSYPSSEYPVTSILYSRVNENGYGLNFHGRPTQKVLSDIPVSFEYLHTEVFGSPDVIAASRDFKDGWVGSWNPSIPDGSGTKSKVTRNVESNADDLITYSSDGGSTWASSVSAHNLNLVINTVSHPSVFSEGGITVYQFKSKSVITEDEGSMEILNGYFGDVYFSSRYSSSNSLAYSLIREVLTGDDEGVSYGNLSLNSYTIFQDEFYEFRQSPTHQTLNLEAPAIDCPAFKTLHYGFKDSNQGFLNYSYCEIKYDAGWGDDGKIHIKGSQGVRLDDNGNWVKYGTARIIEPLGWIKNDK